MILDEMWKKKNQNSETGGKGIKMKTFNLSGLLISRMKYESYPLFYIIYKLGNIEENICHPYLSK
jgi:hypothetical protein